MLLKKLKNGSCSESSFLDNPFLQYLIIGILIALEKTFNSDQKLLCFT